MSSFAWEFNIDWKIHEHQNEYRKMLTARQEHGNSWNGFQFNQAHLLPTRQKVAKYINRLKHLLKNKSATKKELEQTVGNLVFAAWVVPSGRTFISHITFFLYTKSPTQNITLDVCHHSVQVLVPFASQKSWFTLRLKRTNGLQTLPPPTGTGERAETISSRFQTKHGLRSCTKQIMDNSRIYLSLIENSWRCFSHFTVSQNLSLLVISG